MRGRFQLQGTSAAAGPAPVTGNLIDEMEERRQDRHPDHDGDGDRARPDGGGAPHRHRAPAPPLSFASSSLASLALRIWAMPFSPTTIVQLAPPWQRTFQTGIPR